MIHESDTYPAAESARNAAIDNTKAGGNPIVALAMALVYVGDQVGELGAHHIESALDQLGSAIERAGV